MKLAPSSPNPPPTSPSLPPPAAAISALLALPSACISEMIPDGGARALTLQRRFPSSLLRIISSRRLLQDGGLLHFFDTDAAWRFK